MAPDNATQLDAWDGAQGEFWRERADRFDDGVARYSEHLLAAAAVEPGTRALDVGCGSGRVSRDVAHRAARGTVLGVDLSSPLLALARERAAQDGLENIGFLQADAQVFPFPSHSWDLVISRHGVMFFGDAPAAFANLYRALVPGGRLVALTWQPPDRNPWTAFRAVLDLGPPPFAGPGAFSLSDPAAVRHLLTGAGFVDVTLTDLREPMWYGRDADDAHRFLSDQFATALDAMAPDERSRASEALHASLVEHAGSAGVQYDSAAWLIEARRP